MESSDNYMTFFMDSNLISRQIDNDLTYYIYKNNSPVEKAILALVLKVGCVVEEKEQRGMAHFIEHMCLADNFWFKVEDNIQYHIKSRGYTNFDETVFILECLPLTANIQRSIAILKEMAEGSAIKEKNLEAVRQGIINEYERTSQRTDFRIRKKVLPQILNDSYYSNLMPIGELEYIRHFSYDSLLEFHRQWYRPELMAVIAVGDFEADMVEGLILDSFTNLANVEKAKKRIYPTIPTYESKKCAVNYFENLKYSEINLYCMHPRHEICTIRDIKVKLVEYMSCGMTENFLRNEFKKKAIDVQDLICTKNHFLNQYEFNVIAIKTNTEMTKVLTALMGWLTEGAEQGFPEFELQKCKDTFRQNLMASYQTLHTCKTNVLFNECLQNFLFNEPVYSSDYEYELGLTLIDEISMTDIINCQRFWIENRNMAVVINLPEDERHLKKDAAITDYLNRLGCTVWDVCSGQEL